MSAVHHELPCVSALMEANRRHLANVLAPRADLQPKGDIPPRLDRVCTDRVSGCVHVMPRTTTYERPSRIPTCRAHRAGWIAMAVAIVSALALVWLA